MLSILFLLNLVLTSILAFTHWLAVYIKKNKYLVSLAIYNSSLTLLLLISVLMFSDNLIHESFLTTALILHIMITYFLIQESWKEEIKDEIVK